MFAEFLLLTYGITFFYRDLSSNAITNLPNRVFVSLKKIIEQLYVKLSTDIKHVEQQILYQVDQGLISIDSTKIAITASISLQWVLVSDSEYWV